MLMVMTSAIVACSEQTDAPPPDEPGLDAEVMAMEPTSVDPQKIDFPLDAYGRDADLDVVGLAIDVLEQECFRRFGLDLPLPESGVGSQSAIPTWDWYGLWDEETASTHGYQSPPLDHRTSFEMTVPPEWGDVLVGNVSTFNDVEVPEGGCQGEAHRTLGIDDDGDFPSVDGLQRDAVTRGRQHSEVEALIDDWAGCLAEQGWSFDDPRDPFDHWAGRGESDAADGPSSEEMSMGLADIGCKRDTGLLRAWVAAEVAYQRILLEENAEGLNQLAEWRDQVRRKADEVVSDADS